MDNSPVVRIFLPALLISSGLFTCLTLPLALQRSSSIRVNIPFVYQGDIPPIFHPDRRDIAIRYVGISIVLSVAAGFASVEFSRKRQRLDGRWETLLNAEPAEPDDDVALPTTLSSGQLTAALDVSGHLFDSIRCRIAPPDVNLRQTDLSQSDLAAVDLTCIDLSEADLSASTLTEAQLQQADLRHANLRQANLQRANLQQTNCAYADFQYADLQDANLQQASLIGANLTGANVTGARLSQALYDHTTQFPLGLNIGQQGLYWIGPEAPLWGLDLSHANLSGVNLKDANLAGTVLAGADLWGANLEGADLTGANLSGTVLTGASLKGANLAEATLRYANLTDADLTDADLSGVDLTDTVLDGTLLAPSDDITAPQ